MHCGQPWRHFSDEDSYNVVISGGFDCVLSDKGVNRDLASTPVSGASVFGHKECSCWITQTGLGLGFSGLSCC